MNKPDIFMDSGAFSAYTKGLVIDINEYIDFIKKYEDKLTVYANLDVIGDPAATLKNQRIMEDAGLNPLPCFHRGEPVKYLKLYLKEHEYIALGGVVSSGVTTRGLVDWMDDLFVNYLCASKGMPTVKVHGFGITSLPLLKRYPWYCMTEEDHEVLTKTGWKGRGELLVGEEILCYSGGVSVWEPVLDIPVFPVENIDTVEMSNRNFHAVVTENHSWTVTDRAKRGEAWTFKKTTDLGVADCIPRVGEYSFPVEKKYTDAQIELLAWFWTDGTVKKREKYKKDSVVIYQSWFANPEKCKMIENAIASAGEPHFAGKDHWELYGPTRDFLLDIAPNKKLPLSFIFDLTHKQMELFIHCSVLADGSKTGLVRRAGWAITVYREIKKQNLEVLRIACLLLGIPTSVSGNKRGGKCLISSSVDYVYVESLKKQRKRYTGNLWCVQVPSKAFYTRCHNKIYVTGNSVDSTSWVVVSRMGQILVPSMGVSGWDYLRPPLILGVSSKTRRTANLSSSKTLDSVSKGVRKIVDQYIEEQGHVWGVSEFHGVDRKTYKLKEGERWLGQKHKNGLSVVEVIIEPGLTNFYATRDHICASYFLGLQNALPKWPWAFNGKVRKGFGF